MWRVTFIVLFTALGPAAKLRPETAKAFDDYCRYAEVLMQRDQTPPHYLWIDSHPDDKARVQHGDMVIASERSASGAGNLKIPGGEVHDWTGTVFIPHGTIAAARAVMQDYADYKVIYKPDVIDSRLLSQHGDEFHVFLRLYAKQIVTVVFNSEYDITYSQPDPDRMSIRSRSTRIAEVDDPAKSMTVEEPVGEDDGFLWRINSYWRFEEADGGLYAQCRAISLSRGLPFGFGWLRGFIQQFPKQSMSDTLAATRRAIAAR
ncbi:MAG TPA: hypothetical protein VFA04_27595 [Bryobacteraceae bacterium]|nr:hypothetical protein [Bryobacteraceae bacterium]